ncbi:MAG: hypothetical protein ACE5Q6_20410, partial [Dehalococcoidia bacterium]
MPTLAYPDNLITCYQDWKSDPAATARKWSRVSWEDQRHLVEISRRVTELRNKPLRLIVSMPPRHGKSELLSHWTSVWFLANYPEKQVGLGSYSADFAATWGRKTRDTILEIGAEL